MCGVHDLCSTTLAEDPTLAALPLWSEMAVARVFALQVRWSTVLYRMMTRMKSKVSITVAWRPLYQCVRDAYMEPLNTYTGTVKHCSDQQPHPALKIPPVTWLGPINPWELHL